MRTFSKPGKDVVWPGLNSPSRHVKRCRYALCEHPNYQRHYSLYLAMSVLLTTATQRPHADLFTVVMMYRELKVAWLDSAVFLCAVVLCHDCYI